MQYKSCLRKISFTILLLSSLTCTGFAQAFTQTDIQVTFDITWNGTPDQNQVLLGMDSSTDTWITRFTIFDSGIPLSTNCSNSPCESSAYASQPEDTNIRVRIQSTNEPDFSLTPFRYHAFRNLDEFEYFSDGTGNVPDYVGINDVLNGVYVKQGGAQLESWILDRQILGLNQIGKIKSTSQALVQFLNSGNATFQIQENFLNHLQQVSYSKSGTATVSNVLVITAQNNPYPLECSYEVVSNWGTGFQGLVSLENVSNAAVNDWMVTIKFEDAVYLDEFWNSSMTGYIPDFVATSLSWNETIYANQDVNFGFLGSKATSQSANAKVDGKLCR